MRVAAIIHGTCNCLLAFFVITAGPAFAGLYDNSLSRIEPLLPAGQARTELLDRELSQSHGINCMCTACEEVRRRVSRLNDEEGELDSSGQAKVPPRYALQTGIRVAIQNVRLQNIALSVGSVMAELERMERRNDVALPYAYDVSMQFRSSGSSLKRSKVKRRLTPGQAKFREQTENMVANIMNEELGVQKSEALIAKGVKRRFPIKTFFGQKIGAKYIGEGDQTFIGFNPPEKVGCLDTYLFRVSKQGRRIIMITAKCAVQTCAEAKTEQASLRKRLEDYYKRSMEPYEDKSGDMHYSLGFDVDESGEAHREILLCVREKKDGSWSVSMSLFDNDLFKVEVEG